MPRQNRVNPFGELFATEALGTLMGNRGCLHDRDGNIRRSFACRRWIYCLLEFRGRHRTVMAPGRYTELFFLDEATALAAGHRPCAECQHARYRLFRENWTAANRHLVSTTSPTADEIDHVLHAERIDRAHRKLTYTAALADLPSGVMVAGGDGSPYLVLGGRLLRWEPNGYRATVSEPRDGALQVLTPKSIVRAILHGFVVTLLPSAKTPSHEDLPGFLRGFDGDSGGSELQP